MTAVAKLAPIHPGEVLLAEFLEPHGLSQYRLAKDIRVPARRVNEIVLRKRGITADTGLRLSRYVGTSERSGSTSRFDSSSRRSATAPGHVSLLRFRFRPGPVKPGPDPACSGLASLAADAHGWRYHHHRPCRRASLIRAATAGAPGLRRGSSPGALARVWPFSSTKASRFIPAPFAARPT